MIFPWLALALSLNATAAVDFQKILDGDVGCFIELDAKTGKTLREYNPLRCAERLAPCSTFKIPLAFIAFDSKVFATTHDKIPWDKVKHDRPEENHDQTPTSWIANSVVWVSQGLTSKLGEPILKRYLKEWNYGNQDTSGGLTNFWLASSLKISAREQAEFLAKLFNRKYPIGDQTFAKSKEILFNRALKDGSKVYGKTGTCPIPNSDLATGWFVGVIEKGESRRAFAMNATNKVKREGFAGPRTKDRVYEILNDN